MKQMVKYFGCSENSMMLLNDYIAQGWIVKTMIPTSNALVFILFERYDKL
jgi:hypothetical protein